jgi:hypothetical protein
MTLERELQGIRLMLGLHLMRSLIGEIEGAELQKACLRELFAHLKEQNLLPDEVYWAMYPPVEEEE